MRFPYFQNRASMRKDGPRPDRWLTLHLCKDRAKASRNLGFRGLRNVGEDVAEEMHLAALPASPLEHRRDRGLKAFVCVADDTLGAGQAALAKLVQEGRPALFAFRVDDIDSDDIPEARSVHAVGMTTALPVTTLAI